MFYLKNIQKPYTFYFNNKLSFLGVKSEFCSSCFCMGCLVTYPVERSPYKHMITTYAVFKHGLQGVFGFLHIHINTHLLYIVAYSHTTNNSILGIQINGAEQHEAMHMHSN